VQWFDQPTNGIGYFHAHLETEGVPEELSPYLPLFCTALTQVGAAGQPYTEMAERIAAATGGVGAGLTLLDDPNSTGEFRAFAEVGGKALQRNQQKLFGIWHDICGSPDFSDLDRLHTVFSQLRINLENSLPAMGHRYAARVAAASLSPAARLRERWAGIDHIRFVREVAALGVDKLGDVSQRLDAIASALLRRDRIRCGLTGERGFFSEIREAIEPFLAELPGKNGGPPGDGARASDSFVATPSRIGLIASVPVSYVARVFPCVPYTHADAPGLMVLAKLLRAGYLHREIREKGGAYGGMASHAAESGLFSMLSYRDPQLARTLAVYDEAARWAAAGTFDDTEVKEAILGVFSDLDKPLSPGGKGAQEFANTRQGLTHDLRQRMREGVLTTARGTLQALAEKYLVAERQHSAVAVVAGEEALRQANEELGEEALALERI
jgi:Zn-dependent M16 (insulinase) family peptidase